MSQRNFQVLLAHRPVGRLRPSDFENVETDAPSPDKGQILLRNRWLSIDPYMRGRMGENRFGYNDSYRLGEPVGGTTISEVVASDHPDFQIGDMVVADGGWQRFSVSDGTGLMGLPAAITRPSFALGVLGLTGFTAWYGLTRIGQPRSGETLVVSAASGGVGSVVGQLAQLRGCRTVGIAGGPEKCAHVVVELGFDACVDHRAPDLAARLASELPSGVDIYFENVGGDVFDAVWPLMNEHARVPVCGQIAYYEATSLGTRDRLPAVAITLITKRIRMEGFGMNDHFATEFGEFLAEVAPLVADGSVKALEDVTDGLEKAPEALMRVLAGANFGKALVRIDA